MNILEILKNLYTNRDCKWINSIDDNEIQPYTIQRWLAMNDSLRVQTRWLDKYVFVLSPKMYLSLAWSIIPKLPKTPYNKYIQKKDENEEFDFILKLIRKHYNIADNDYYSIKERLIKTIKEDMVWWFSYYGIEKRYWKKYYIKFELIKEFGNKPSNVQKGLDVFGL